LIFLVLASRPLKIRAIMKAMLCFAMLSMGLAVPPAAASEKAELESLRVRCAEQEKQIRRLEDENLKLRSGSSAQASRTERALTDSSAPAKATVVDSSVPAKAAAADAASYTVRPGDTMEKIARKFDCSAEKLAKANGLKLSSIIRPGQVIRLTASGPVKSPVTAATPPKKSAPPASAPVKSSTPDATAPAKKPAEASSSPEKSISQKFEKKTRAVTIESKMTYGEFAAKHGTDVSRLNELNGLDLTQATVLAEGSELYVPAQP
jgi:LysM repeat protein